MAMDERLPNGRVERRQPISTHRRRSLGSGEESRLEWKSCSAPLRPLDEAGARLVNAIQRFASLDCRLSSRDTLSTGFQELRSALIAVGGELALATALERAADDASATWNLLAAYSKERPIAQRRVVEVTAMLKQAPRWSKALQQKAIVDHEREDAQVVAEASAGTTELYKGSAAARPAINQDDKASRKWWSSAVILTLVCCSGAPWPRQASCQDFLCPPDYILSVNASLKKADVDTCCQRKASCSSFACPSDGFARKANASTLLCSGLECGEDDTTTCCDIVIQKTISGKIADVVSCPRCFVKEVVGM